MKRETREKWERANSTRDCWDKGFLLHPPGIPCLLASVDDLDVVSNGDGRLHEIAASLALDGCDIRELP